MNAQHGFGLFLPSLGGVCGASDLQPSCTTFGLAIFALTAVVLCLTTTIGMLLLRRRLAPLLKASSVLMSSAFLLLFLPLVLIGSSLNKLAGAVVVMAVFPIFLLLLFAGTACFLVWGTRGTYRAIRKRYRTHRISSPSE